MVNTKEFKKLMIDKGVTINDISAALNICDSSVRRKLDNKSPMNLEEAEKIQEFFGIAECDFTFYFLGHEV